MTEHSHEATRAEFRDAVTMTPAALRMWLDTEESRSVGMVAGGDTKSAPGGKEAVGHHMGQRIVEIKETKQSNLTDDDYADMRKVIGYAHRHAAQRPKGDVEDSRWRHSLMNWGHDPLHK